MDHIEAIRKQAVNFAMYGSGDAKWSIVLVLVEILKELKAIRQKQPNAE